MTVTEQSTPRRDGPDEHDSLVGLVDKVTQAGEAATSLPVEAPFTGETIGAIPACTDSDVEVAVDRARRAQESWAARSIEDRVAVIRTFHDLLLDREDEILDIVQLESGKARRDAHEELLDVAINARYYAHRADEYLSPDRRDGAVPGLTKTYEYRHPVGVVGIISPWNYPLTLTVSDAIPAVLAGNAVVLKPARHTSYTALAGVRLLREAGIPDDIFQVVTGHGRDLGPPLIDRVDFIGFTGSTATGRKIAAQAGENLVKSSLELGGKNPAIVLPDADLDRAADGLVRGAFANAGQLCISLERLYVHSDVYGDFIERFVTAAGDLELGAEYDHDVEMGSLISADQLEKVQRHVADARERGATVLAGGEPRPDIGPYFFEPTILTDVDEEMVVACDETFGPVVSVYTVDSVEEAVARANDSEYGLNASIWTGDEDQGIDIASRIQCGTVNVNEAYAAAYGSVDAPMGGMKDSGMGRRHGDEGILKYTESQTIASQRVLPATAPPGLSYSTYAALMNRAMRVMEKVPGLR